MLIKMPLKLFLIEDLLQTFQKKKNEERLQTLTDFSGPQSGLLRMGLKGQAIHSLTKGTFRTAFSPSYFVEMGDLKSVICITMSLKTDSLS